MQSMVDLTDILHAGRDRGSLVHELWAEAMGPEYPTEVQPFGSCSWWVRARRHPR
jgi:hypothetical protein